MNFRKIYLGILVLFVGTMVQANLVNIILRKDRESYMQYEPIKLHLLIQNQAGNPIEFKVGSNHGHVLSREQKEALLQLAPEEREVVYKRMITEGTVEKSNFTLEVLVWNTKEISPLPKTLSLSAPMKQLPILGTGESKEVSFVLNRFVPSLSQPGEYTLEVRLTHERLGKVVFRSNRLSIVVLGGRVIKKMKVGAPTLSADSVISERYGILQQSVSSTNRFYFFQIQDDRKNYRTTRLANVINLYEPSLYVDAFSNFHLLFMTNPSLYEYRVYGCDGKLLIRNFYKPGGNNPNLISEPRLLKDAHGEVNVINAAKAVEGKDFTLRSKVDSDLPAVE